MFKKQRVKYILGPILIVTIFLSSCTKTNYDICPAYPVAGEKVANEIAEVPYEGHENFWEWLGRINKLRQELELCD